MRKQGLARRASRLGLVVVSLALGASTGTAAAETAASPSLETALSQVTAPGWVREGTVREFTAENLWEYINGDADRYVAAGLSRMGTATFRLQGKVEAIADVYRMTGPEAARRIFQSESTQGWAVVELGDEGRFSEPTLICRAGADFVRIVAYETTPETRDALLKLSGALIERLRAR